MKPETNSTSVPTRRAKRLPVTERLTYGASSARIEVHDGWCRVQCTGPIGPDALAWFRSDVRAAGRKKGAVVFLFDLSMAHVCAEDEDLAAHLIAESLFQQTDASYWVVAPEALPAFRKYAWDAAKKGVLRLIYDASVTRQVVDASVNSQRRVVVERDKHRAAAG